MIHENIVRVGNFNSSKIVALTKLTKDKKAFGEKAITFIAQKNYERRLGRSITTETTAKATNWGNLCESIAFDKLGLDYSISSQETDTHPSIDYWVGSKDGLKHDEGKTVIDIKCPITLESFCGLVQPIYDGLTGMDAMNKVRDNHKEGETYYWQLVSNAIINNCKYAELIVFVPYKSELEEIKLAADGQPNLYWVAMSSDSELPYILDVGYYKNINVIRFEVPQEDKDFLTEQILKAGKLLIDRNTFLLATYDQDLKATIIE
jgi:hypothetical protein